MRSFGQKFRSSRTPFRSVLLCLLAISASPITSAAQTAPYVLPYTMSTFAGPHAAYTVGQACSGSATLIALDSAGDGCLASQVGIGVDPHDIRVDGKGNVYWEDNTSSAGVVHRISPYNQLETIYDGNLVSAKGCSKDTKYGNGCTATDGAANTGPAAFTPVEKANRGLSIAPNGDLLLAGYNLNMSQKIAAYTDLLSLVAGTATSGYIDAVVGSALVASPRGISEDANGNVYIADTGNNVLRVVYSGLGTIPPVFQYTSAASPTTPVTPVAGQTYSVTAPNPGPVKYAGSAATSSAAAIPGVAAPSGVPAISSLINAPEDVQIDSFGNIFIADAGNNLVRAIYMAGTLPGITNPVPGYIYTIAGSSTFTISSAASGSSSIGTVNGGPNTTYPTDGSTPTRPATSVALTLRKMAFDKYNNLYIADSGNQVVWFVDHLTGDIRLIAGSFGGSRPSVSFPLPALTQQLSVPINCPAHTDAVGDGCPASFAAITASADMGTSADSQGNLYITDAENAVTTSSLLRKVLSGLNFPTLVVKTSGTPNSVTQNVLMHFAPNDTPAATNPYTIAATGTDFKLGSPINCTIEADATDDCIIPITFTPTQPGYDTATLTVNTTAGASAAFLITGTGSAPTIAFDPGNISLSGATVSNPQAVTLDGAGTAYIADTANNRILRTAGGATTIFAGTGSAGYTGDGGAATAATFNAPRGVAIDTSGSLYIADSGNNVIRKVDATGHITTYAGGASTVCAIAGNTRGDGCPALQATFKSPTGLAADNLGQLYVADSGNNVIRQISTTTYVTTLAGGAATICAANTDTVGDGCSANATTFNAPTALAFDATGQNLFVADTGNNRIRKISLNNSITVKGTLASLVLFNPVSAVAGNGQAGTSVDQSSVATNSMVNAPTGIAVDAAGNVYIADTGNSSIRLVNANGGLISTIVGILGSSGTGSVTGSAVAAQLATPAAIAVSPTGTLTILDSGNNRILTDTRSQITYNFGRINVPTSSPAQNFTELNIGVTGTAFGNPVFTPPATPAPFTLAPVANSTGVISACAGALASGAICNIQGQFNATTVGSFSAAYAENSTTATGGAPTVTLVGIGAVLTTTTSTVAQTVPATGNSQFGGSVTFTATIAPAACNTAAPSCFPTGTVSFVVDGTATAAVTLAANGTASQMQQGLSVGQHTISCNYGGDDFYAASSCANFVITVAQASTTSVTTATPNNQPQFPTTNCVVLTQPPALQGDTQCTATTLSATVKSNTTGSPTGTITFFATGGPLGSTKATLGTQPLDPTTSTASLSLSFITDPNRNLISDNTLAPGTYSLTCSYSGASNYATSTCAAISFTVVPQLVDFNLVTRGCSIGALAIAGTSTPGEGVACNPGPENFSAGVPLVTVAQGSTTDATIFINTNNTAAGTYTFSCSGLPAASTCTFSPAAVTTVATTGYNTPLAVDMTLWTDLQPGTASLRTSNNSSSLALLLGWPITFLGLAGILRFRRKTASMRGLTALLLLLTGSSLLFTGCGSGGPGAYQANLTPAGTYPITVTVTGAGVTHTTLVKWTVTAPGIPGQE